MPLIYADNVQDKGSTIQISVFSDVEPVKEGPITVDDVIPLTVGALHTRMDAASREFDDILLKYKQAQSEFRKTMTTTTVEMHERKVSTTADGYIEGYFNVMLDHIDDYAPEEVDISLPEPGKLVVQGNKPGNEFCEEIPLPENVDDEEISVIANSYGKVVIQAPLLS